MEEKQDNWLSGILYSLAWLVCSLLIIVDVLMIREATLVTLRAVQANQIEASAPGEKTATRLETGSLLQAIDQGMMFGGGIVAVVLALAIEYYFRLGKQQGKLLKHIGIVLGILAAIFIASVLIQTFV